MKQFQHWFNQLTTAQQKIALILFCLLFATMLILSISYQRLIMNTGSIVQARIKTDTLKHK